MGHLEDILEEIFFKTAAEHSSKKDPPNREEVQEVVGLIAKTMRDMKLVILPNNLLKENNDV